MSNTRNTKWIWVCAIIALIVCHSDGAWAQATGSSSSKDNPFASVLKKQQYASVQNSGDIQDEYALEMPNLSVETVELKFVDAKTASEAFSCLCSEVGRIVPRESGNSVIVFDTPENIEKVVTEIKKSDRPIESLTLQYVGLTFIDANSVIGALSTMVSAAGSVVEVDRTNGVILCDAKLNVEAMVKEIEKLDHPMVHVQVRPITFTHTPVSSAQAVLSPMLSKYGSISVIARTNTLVVCDLPQNLEEIAKEAQALDREAPGLVVEKVTLKFLAATNIATVVEKMLSQDGSVVSDDLTETVIICDTRENVARIVSQIKKVDEAPAQIMVETILLDVRLDDDEEIGINWDFVSTDYRNRTSGGYYPDGSTTTFPFDTNKRVGVGTGFDASASSSLGGMVSVLSGSVHALVNAIQTTKDVEIIASPRAMVLSGKQATILAAEQVPYEELNSTSQGGSMTSTSFKEVGVTLIVTATLTEDEEIVLAVDVQQSVRTGESLGGVPVIDQRQNSTSLLLKDGQVVIMGGLRRQEKTVTVTKVPLLGDLPLLGNLFRTRRDVLLNSELVVLLSPQIYKNGALPGTVQEKYDELLEKAPLTGAVSQQSE